MVVIIGVCAFVMSLLTVVALLRLPQIWRQEAPAGTVPSRDQAALRAWLAHLRAVPATVVAGAFLSLASWGIVLNSIGWIPDSWVIALSVAWILATLVSLCVLVLGRPSLMVPPGQRNRNDH
jgi:hypothetical protein